MKNVSKKPARTPAKQAGRRRVTSSDEAIRESELHYRRLFESTQDGILIVHAETGRIEDINPYLLDLLEYSRDEILKWKVWQLHGDPKTAKRSFEKLQAEETFRQDDLPLETKNGRVFTVECIGNTYQSGKKRVIQYNIRNITERKRAEEHIQLQANLLDQVSDAIIATDLQFNILYWNAAAQALYGWREGETLGKPMSIFIKNEYSLGTTRVDIINDVHEKGFWRGEVTQNRRDGTRIPILATVSSVKNSQGEPVGYIVVNLDITEWKKAEEYLQREKSFSESILNSLPGIFYLFDDQGRFLRWNKNFEKVSGYPSEEIAYMNPLDFFDGDDKGLIEQRIRDVFTTGGSHAEAHFISKDGTRTPFYFTGLRLQVNEKTCLIGVGMDITERKHVEKTLKDLSHAINASGDAVFMTDKDGIITSVNSQFTDLYGYTPDEVIGKTTPRILKSGAQSPEYYKQFWRTIQRSQLIRGEVVNKSKDGKIIFIEETVNPFLDDRGNIAGYLAIQRNVTERKRAEEDAHRQLGHLKALREIDSTITSSFDMRTNLSTLLKYTTAELVVDAASILLLNPTLNILEYTAGYGFRTRAIEKSSLPVTDGYAGRAAMQRILVRIEDLNRNPSLFARAHLLEGEEFVCYFGVPIIAKGLVKGVLEVFHRSPLEPDQEWLDFLYTLTGQAAIAIEDAQLFRNLQQSNMELLQAYDTTIEGWSNALDLRDKETEGHTQRVTDMAIRLGRMLGLRDEELKNMRWGGLLHDIGKMGVPDAILFKKENLSFDEMEIMKMHTTFAYQMLAPIHYLKAALDIPYCHHEKWDGTGYPRGLQGEQIPLPARIFAVADVYDALTSDRPYRDKWKKTETLIYIRAQAGNYFDPHVVDMFMQMIEEHPTDENTSTAFSG